MSSCCRLDEVRGHLKTMIRRRRRTGKGEMEQKKRRGGGTLYRLSKEKMKDSGVEKHGRGKEREERFTPSLRQLEEWGLMEERGWERPNQRTFTPS